MSLDVSLIGDTPQTIIGSGIFIREGGRTKEITRQEWEDLNPGVEPVRVNRDPDAESDVLYTDNITHNLGAMAAAALIYTYLWCPDENDITTAAQLIEPLSDGLYRLKTNPAAFEIYNPKNGWGSYQGLVEFVEDYLKACMRYPEAKVSVWR